VSIAVEYQQPIDKSLPDRRGIVLTLASGR
jgi:hypothetical protein